MTDPIRQQRDIAVAALEKIANRGAGPLAHRLECQEALAKIAEIEAAPGEPSGLTPIQIDHLKKIREHYAAGSTVTSSEIIAIGTLLQIIDLLLPSEPSCWWPIETAPRDGTKILLWDGSIHIICKWGAQEAWVTAWDGSKPFDDEIGPTHWQSLPEPPAPGAAP